MKLNTLWACEAMAHAAHPLGSHSTRPASRAWDCPYHRLTFDMGHISWVLTSNRLSLVPETVVSRLAGDGGLSDPAAEALVEAVERAGERWQLSLRDVNRMLDRGMEMDSMPTVR